MKNKVILTVILFIILLFCAFRGWDFFQKHNKNKEVLNNILYHQDYKVSAINNPVVIELFVSPNWIPFNEKKPLNINKKLMNMHDTNIILKEVWNRGNDIYFSFHTTYNLDDQSGYFLYNMKINGDGTFESTGSYSDFHIFDVNKHEIQLGETGWGPESDFSFSIEPEEYEKIKSGFYINYSGMMLYKYSRK
ncbi:hypothetical protein SAMN04487895_102285 [Paenibacillus sophorae]|uniref:Uncharacterized protein n=1 Tax=Paenibacillus sophorae TaxID=1333845 RepID=A0A1H8IPW1_9BACL|nr:hypothetical protein [Paenibacillus sophorae]QWU16043.1 hypothetical protein KP014_01810 [Paenibacillus sophorae]SEN70703.1 hypothetical protein SAMN04487895_102285 [Paenibacillus sophorae]